MNVEDETIQVLNEEITKRFGIRLKYALFECIITIVIVPGE